MADEQGTGFSLRPWGENTNQYTGSDDGGKEYYLPEGYELAETQDGEKEIFHGNVCCRIKLHSSVIPQLISAAVEMPVLDLVKMEA